MGWRALHKKLFQARCLGQSILTRSRPDTTNKKTRAEEWKLLQSEWRWVNTLIPYLGPPSFLLWRIRVPLIFNLIIAACITLDAYFGTFGGMVHGDMSADVLLIWRMTSFILALLLAFRVNKVYMRWQAAVQAFAGVGSVAVTLGQQAAVWVPDQQLQGEILKWCGVWQFSLQQLCSRSKTLSPKAAELLAHDELDAYASAPKPRQLVVLQLRQLITLAGLDHSKFLQMNDTLNKGNADMGTCGRTFFHAMPYAITLLCSGVLEIWLLLMPLATVVDSPVRGTPGDYANVPAVLVDLMLYLLACVLMLGVEDVAVQLEQPFAHIPMLDMADATLRAVGRVPFETQRMAQLTHRRLSAPTSLAGCAGQRVVEARDAPHFGCQPKVDQQVELRTPQRQHQQQQVDGDVHVSV